MEPVAGDTDRMETDRLLLRRFSGEDAEELALDLWEVLQDPKYREGSGTAEGMVSERVFLGQGGAENMQCDGEK